MRILFFLLSLVCLLITGCSQVKVTSGRDYIRSYIASIKDNKSIAKVEPIKFPARIGIARIDNGVLTSIPSKEVEEWEKLKNELGKDIGEFVPVSRLISAMVSKSTDSSYKFNHKPLEESLYDILRSIRLGAARQHLDVVLIYELYGTGSSKITIAYIMNFTIIGAFLFPGRRVHASGYGSAILLDVRSGELFGTANSYITKKALMTSPNSYQKQIDLTDKTKMKAGINLVPEVKKMILQLNDSLKNLETPKK